MVKLPLFTVICIVIVGLGIVLPAEKVEADPKTRQQITHLIKLTNVDTMIAEMIATTMTRLERSFPQVSPEVFQEATAGVNPEEVIEQILVPIYEHYFSPSEIEELVRFYESPVGRKFMAVRPQMMQEAAQALQQWGDKLAQTCIKQLDKDHQ